MVTSEVVEQACTEVGDYSEEQMASEFERFFKAQPELCDFVVELTNDSDQKIQELSLFLSYMVFKTVQKAEAAELPAVTHSTIEEAFRQSEAWMEKFNRVDKDAVHSSILSSFDADSEPHLLHYVITEINQMLDDGTSLTDEQKGEVFFVLKTVISTLLRRSFERESTEKA
jgi:hypothetical protein